MNEELRFDRACQWFIDLREQPESPQLVADWLAWCRADPLNREAFERAREVWQVTADADSSIFPSPASGVRDEGLLFRPLALAASVAVAALLLYQFVIPKFLTQPQNTTLVTRLGENRAVKLADGSTVTLGANTQLVTHFDAHARHLILERGEAYFRVQRDRARPFVVTAGNLRVTAIGTAFNVRTGPDRVVVTVAEGVVAVDPPGISQDKPLRATVGQQVAIDTGGGQMQLNRIEPQAAASWQSGRLEFTREPLRAVIDSVNRYSPRPIELNDPQLGDLRYTGTVFADRVDDWLDALPRIFPVVVHEASTGVAIVPAP